MGLSKPQGSLHTTSSPVNNNNVTNVPHTKSSALDHLKRQSHIRDSFHTKNAINTQLSDTLINSLQGYSEGSPITVTWFNQMDGIGSNRTTQSDLSFKSANVHHSYLRINNFEIKLKSGFDFSYNETETQSSLNGEAFIYPGFIPKVGDLFLYEIEAGSLGLFKVNNPPSRLTIKSSSGHDIQFELITIPSNEDLTLLLDRVRDEAWFDKQRFLTEEHALITKEEVQDLEFIDSNYSDLRDFYIDKFYNSDGFNSIVRPDNIYDPYIVNFIKRTIEFPRSNRFITQLVDDPVNEEFSVWEKLLNVDKVHRDIFISTYEVKIHEISSWSYDINALVNRPYISLSYEHTDAYISDNVLGPNLSTYSEFDMLLNLFLEHEVIDSKRLTSEISSIHSLTPIEQFYRIPVLLFMLSALKNSIHFGEDVKVIRDKALPYREFEFSQENLIGNLLEITGIDIDVIGLVTASGDVLYFESTDILTTDTKVVIDLTLLFDENSITEIDGVWKVVFKTNQLITL